MAARSTNPHRFDPYKNFKFRVKIDGRIVAGAVRVTGLTARKLPGIQKYPNVTLKRGLTHDAEFQKWAAGKSHSRKDVVVEIYDEAGKLAKSYKVHRVWVSKYQSSDLKAGANEVGIEMLTLENEGIELVTGH